MEDVALNLMWIENRWVRTESEKTLEDYIPNVIEIARKNKNADILFWVDEQEAARNSSYKAALEELFAALENAQIHNVKRSDLRSIEEYRSLCDISEPLEIAPPKRNEEGNPFWNRVDAAKILVCRECTRNNPVGSLTAERSKHYQNVFFCDLDITLLNTDNLGNLTHGFLIGALEEEHADDQIGLENQLFGFDRNHFSFFERLHQATTADDWSIIANRRSVFDLYGKAVTTLLKNKNLSPRDIAFVTESDLPATKLEDSTSASLHPPSNKKSPNEPGGFR